MRILSTNLWNGRARVDDLGRLLDAVDAEVVVAQEVGFDAAEVLRDRFPHGVVTGADDCSGRAMVSRRPMEVRDLEMPLRHGLRATMRLEDRPLEIIGVHIANPVDGIPAFRHRRDQVRAIEEVIDAVDACIVVGDYNSTPSWPLHRRLRRRLTDLVSDWSARTGEPISPTWGPSARSPALLRIDHVLGRGVEVVSHRTHRVAGTDHRAVEVGLGWASA